MRGKLRRRKCFATFSRITPAGAGKTLFVLLLLPFYRDHPRRCGENAVSQPVYTIRPGSPPQVRGKLTEQQVGHMIHGITPAGAGKTHQQQRVQHQRRDHPRRCGENCHIFVTFAIIKGSPPQVRGKLNFFHHSASFCGITPAGAGKTECPVSAV